MPESGSWTFRAKADSRLFSLVLHGAVVRKKLEKKRLPRPLHPASWNACTAWLALGHASLHHDTAFSALCTLEMWTRKGALCIRIGFNNFLRKNTFTTLAPTSFYCIQFLTKHCFFLFHHFSSNYCTEALLSLWKNATLAIIMNNVQLAFCGCIFAARHNLR